MNYKKSKEDVIIDLLIYIVLFIVGIITIYPFWNVTVLAFNDALDTIRGGVYFWPRVFSLENFRTVLLQEQIKLAFTNSILRTVIGVICGLICDTMLAYTLSRKDYIFRNFIQKMFVITMYVSGGLIPYYLVVRSLGMRNHFIVYILPLLINVFYILVIRSFIESLPLSTQESAKIDGANDFIIYAKIIMPMSIPVIATITLFIAVDQWNSWFDTYLFTNGKELTTLQFELQRVLRQSTAAIQNIDDLRRQLASGNGKKIVTTPESLRMAITVVATVPILIVYPFIQKYFIKGMTLGSIKE